MQPPSLLLERPFPRLRSISLPRVRADVGVAVALVLLYLVVGAVVTFGYHAIVGDTWSRVGNAYYVLFSRDPHLGAIGFVWTPLPSLLVMPLLPLGAIFPGLIREGFAANVVSAIAMGLAVYQLYGFLLDLRVRTSLRWILTGLFGLNPMIVLYGANGMSEAIFVVCLVTTIRYVARWMQTASVAALVVAAIALALAYLTRYEAVVAAASASAVVAGVSFLRARGTGRRRGLAVAADLAVLLMPAGSAFIVWALASWLLTGDPFPIFTSIYGNSAYVERAANFNAIATGQGTPVAVAYVTAQLVGLAPLLPVAAIAAIGAAAWRRDPRVLVVLAVFGAILAFQVYAFLSGRTYGWLRFYIATIPMATMLVALCVAEDRGSRLASIQAPRFVGRVLRAVGRSRWPRVMVGGILAGTLAFGFTSGLNVMADRNLGRGETAEQVNAMLGHTGAAYYEQYSAEQYLVTSEVADALNGMNLPRGSVLADSATAFPVIMQVRDPRIFVITSDRDFEAALADPKAFDVEYVLVPPNFQGHDAVNRAYPDLYRGGAAFTELVTTFDAQGQSPDWRLFRVIAHT